MRRGAVVLSLLLWAFSQATWAQSEKPAVRLSAARMTNTDEVRRRLGLAPNYDNLARVDTIKVAVLDYGFEGMGDGRPYLPATAELVEHYDPEFVRRFDLGDPKFRKGFEPGNTHGRFMGQIVWAISGGRPTGPKFYLLNANGPTMLRRAVRYAIEQKVDIILFSGSFEGGGSGDGRGPINRIVYEALAADIIWINAAGNYGRRVYNGPVRVLNDGYLKLRDSGDIAALRFRNRVDDNTITVTLTWNDYRDEEDAGTDKDLDLYVEDAAGRKIGSSEKVQITGPDNPGANETKNPRERIVLASLPANPEVPSDPEYGYKIRIKSKAGHLTSADRVRVLVNASRDYYLARGENTPREACVFVDASGEGECYPPADNPKVFTVGDTDPGSSIGSTGELRLKPDVLIDDSRAFFSDGEISGGSSDAAAFVAGAVVVLKAAAPVLRTNDLFRFAALGPVVPASALRGRSAQVATSQRFHLWQTPDKTRLAQVIMMGR